MTPPSDEEKRRISQGPFGTIMSRFALQFGKAAFFGPPPGATDSSHFRNGTVTLVNLGKGPIGITCSHVIKGYRESLAKYPKTVFQIGHCQFDPIKYLIADSPALDLATLDLRDGRMEEVLTKEAPGNQFYIPPKAWPPGKVEVGNVVASFGGFPGLLRKQTAVNEFVFGAFCHSGGRVDSASDRHFACHFEREYWVTPSSPESSRDFKEMQGMSGGPVFIDRGIYNEFVGVIHEFSPTLDLMHVRLARFVKDDGTIDDV